MIFKYFADLKRNAGYFWAEKKREAFFAVVATFALGQVLYKDMQHRGYINAQKEERNKTITPVAEAKRRRKQNKEEQ